MSIDETLLKSDEKAVFALRSLYSRFGYSRFKMSKFEEYDLYVKNKDFLVSDGIITFTDTNGHLKALKPDVTLSIINNIKDESTIRKLYYDENVYRISGSTHTYKEITQTGLECIGNIGLLEICEVLSLAAKSLETVAENGIMELSHVGIIEAAFSEAGVPSKLYPRFISCINRKSNDDMLMLARENGLDARSLSVFTKNYPIAKQALDEIASVFKSDEVMSALDEFKTIISTIENCAGKTRIIVDFSAVGAMAYYSGVVFRGYIEGIPEAVLSGGQYDRLMKKLDHNVGAIGFAVYLDALQGLDNFEKEYDVDTVLLCGDDIAAAINTSEMLSCGGSSVLLCREIPSNISYRRAVRLSEKGVETVNGNDKRSAT